MQTQPPQADAKPAAKPAAKRLSKDELDFAPGLLSIQESPPAKLPRVVLYSVALLFGILLVWAIFAELDVVASADGRLIPQTYVKIVQPSEAGVVRDILVSEGQVVHTGEVLMRMDARLMQADARALRSEFDLKRLILRRIDAELKDRPMQKKGDDPLVLFVQVEQQQMARRQAYQDALAQERANYSKTKNDLAAAKEVLQKLTEIVPTYRRSADAFERLGKDGFYSTLAVEEKHRDRIEKEQDLRAQQANVESLKDSVLASQRKLAQIKSAYHSELQNERVETESQFQKLGEEIEKIEHKSELLVLRAPQRGVIKDLATHTIGTVVSPGSVLMSLVPQDDPLQAEIQVKNEDVAFVHEQQRVKIKLAAYPFQKYGMLDGVVSHLGPDAAEAPSAGNSAGKAAGDADPSGGLRYKALVKLDEQHLQTDGLRMKLTPGMQVVVEIHQGKRTVMAYLLSPVHKAWQEAGRER
jgi:HlyD family secretion protein